MAERPGRCSVFIAASVDGFIARPDDDVSWLEAPEYRTEESYGITYEEFISTVDALVMGRRSFEKVLTFEPWPYEIPVVVLSSGEVRVPEELRQQVTVERGAPEAVVDRLAARGITHLYVDGGVTIQRFLQAGLIDEMIITWIPILLGGGVPLFGSIGGEMPLELLGATSGANGFVQTHYRASSVRSPGARAEGSSLE